MSFSNKLQNNFGQEYAIKNNIPQENAGLMIENKEPDNTEEEKEKEETNPNQEINNLFLSPEPSGHSLLLGNLSKNGKVSK